MSVRQIIFTSRRLTAYSLAVLLPIATLVVSYSLSGHFGERPLLILFMFPIIVCAMLGSIGPGIVATVLATGLTLIFVIPPVGEIAVANSFDLLQWGMLVCNALLVSLLAELNRRKSRWLERDLQSSQAQLRQLLQTTDQCIYGIDLNGGCTFINNAGLRTLGYQFAECHGKNMHDLIHHSHVDGSPYRVEDCPIAQVAVTGKGIRVSGEVLWRKDGNPFPSQHSSYPIVDNGKVTGVVVTFSDISEQMRNEDELRQARDLADSANVAKSAFLSNMSHEIRTPMNAIVGFTHVLQRTIKIPSQLDQVEKIAGAADHLLCVVNDILDLSKIESNKLILERSDFNLDELLTRICSMVIDQVRAKGLELIIDTDHRVGLVCGDSTRLSQALLNYLANAVKFTERGTIILHVRRVDESVDTILVRFEIKDSGIGIAPNNLQRLFQRFEQADNSTTRRFGGTGLGLAITRRLAELMDGEVGANSTPEVGSTFWMTARLGKGNSGTGRYLIPELMGKRALVVDDTPITRLVQTQLLRETGLDSEGVPSGSSALEVIGSAEQIGRPFDLVLIDLFMPGKNGIETLADIRLMDLLHQPLALLATASGGPTIIDDSLNAGFTDVLFKPLSLIQLHSALTKHVRAILKQVCDNQRPGSDSVYVHPRQLLHRNYQDVRILLTEDDALNQEVALLLLEEFGWRIDVADNGKKAVDMVAEVDYQLILMDMHMPIMDGIEATRLIRQLPRGAHVPIVAMTANAFAEDKVRCMEAGMNDFMVKPFDPNVLFSIVLRWLDQKPV